MFWELRREHQESCTCEFSQQAQNGHGHKMVESVEQQIARALADGSSAHQTTTPAATAGADCKASHAPAQDGERGANRRGTRRDLGNGHPDARGTELQVLKDVHWKALTVLDKLHRRDWKAREKAIAENAREASQGAAGLLHRLTKPRAVWCPRDTAQVQATNPRDAAELAAKSWSRIWRVHVEELKTGDRPWETPNDEDMSVLLQLEVDGLSGFDAVVGSFKAKTGIGVDAIHSSMWSRISEMGEQLYTDLLNDVERTLTWPAHVQTLIYFLVPKTPTGERPIGLMPSIVRVWELVRKPTLDQWMISQTRSYDWASKVVRPK